MSISCLLRAGVLGWMAGSLISGLALAQEGIQPPGNQPPPIPDDATVARAANLGELVFIGKVASVTHSPAVGLSSPPLRSMTIDFSEGERLRGTLPEKLSLRYQVRADVAPTFLPESKQLVVARKPDGKNWLITQIVPATESATTLAKKAVELPIGWTLVDGKPLSPWGAQGATWPGKLAEKPGEKTPATCAKSGRPALLAAAGIEVKVEQVIPEKRHEFRNPYGDGEFKVTVTNTGKAATVVPALLVRGGEIQWDASLVFVQGDKAFALAPSAGDGEWTSKTLAAGESVSGVVNTLRLDGVNWPRGGSRVHLTFALGDLSAGNFFYYFSDHHDKLRPKK